MMTTGTISPVRVIQTESPSISCLAVSALFLVHGGSDGLVQAWDPLASTTDPLRTLNARSSGRMIPRHSVHANPALRLVTHPAVGAIVLDPDPAVLRGVLTCGLSVRFWTYSATSQALGRKRRTRHLDMHGRLASRREGGGVSGYIAAETAELRHEQQQRTRELQRLRTRFGIGFGDLTEEEAVLYAQMISEESFMQDEQRRTSASDSGDSGSAADRGDLTSCLGSTSGETVTPEPSVSGASANPLRRLVEDDEDDYEDPMQRAIRLSRLDGVNELGQSPRGHTFGSIGLQVKVKESKRGQRSGKRSSSSPASPAGGQLPTRMVQHGECSRGPGPPPAFFTSPSPRDEPADPDEDLELALQLSLVEEQSRQEGMARPQQVVMGPALGDGEEEYPALDVKGKGKMA
ncbi:hypothetical protein P8C59_005551 [Phyllachora maydis]|uniref:Uncharacterized protein n=1 Tax=Phyllachora maydis TaxID=1825666 RepID=A0AAD9MDL8_9PEZI|nr:hypothetical protein P8C59_005551 [Phyllachora maydis]